MEFTLTIKANSIEQLNKCTEALAGVLDESDVFDQPDQSGDAVKKEAEEMARKAQSQKRHDFSDIVTDIEADMK